jgi:DNA repair protein RadD
VRRVRSSRRRIKENTHGITTRSIHRSIDCSIFCSGRFLGAYHCNLHRYWLARRELFLLELRPFQQRDKARLRQSYADGKKAPLYVCPTGGGKTFLFSDIARGAAERGNRVLITTHRAELLHQSSRSLSALGVQHGLIAPGFHGEKSQVVVGSIQTIARRLKKAAMHFDLIVIDEAHHTIASQWACVLQHFSRARRLGVTATPVRLDGAGLGEFFDDLVLGPSVAELIADGYLVQPEVYAPPTDLDLEGVGKRFGEYKTSELAARVDKPTVTGSAVEHYTRFARGEPAIVFCASLSHAAHVCETFRSAGYRAAVIHGKLDDTQRQAMIKDLASGALHLLVSVDLISEGTDIPVVSVGILLRPTQSMGLHIQQCGRILRPAKNKKRALILDHVGNNLKHGLPDTDREWTLDGVSKTNSSNDEDALSVRQCKSCFHVWERGPRCPSCGEIAQAKPRKIEEREGELTRLTKEEVERVQRAKRQQVGRAKTRDELETIARERGYARGWVDIQLNIRRRRGG